MTEIPSPAAPKNLVTKLAEIMAAVERVPKNGWNDHFKYHYATEADVAEALRKEMAGRNVVMFPNVKSMEFRGADKFCVLDVEWTIRDGDSPEQITFHVPGMGQDSNDKGPYKALTGSQKYALMKFFHVPTGDDPERDSEAPASPQRRQRAGRQPGETPAEYSARKPEPPADDVATKTTIPFGDAKGQSVRETPTAELLKVKNGLERSIANPEKAKYRRSNEGLVLVIVGELERRQQVDEPPFEHEGPKTPAPPPRGIEQTTLPDPAASSAEREALMLKVKKLADAVGLTNEERMTAWSTYVGPNANAKNADVSALNDLIGWLQTRADAKGAAA